jgi:hypothetical protein
MVLLSNMIEVLDLQNLKRDPPIYTDVIRRSFVGTASIQGDGFRVIVMPPCFIKESLGRAALSHVADNRKSTV